MPIQLASNYTFADDSSLLPVFFYRNDEGQMMVVTSDQTDFQSVRYFRDKKLAHLTWIPHRQARMVPLVLESVVPLKSQKGMGYSLLPAVLRGVFDSGNFLRTAPTSSSDFSALMYATKGKIPHGRLGTVFFKNRPLIVSINGLDFTVEIKGVGIPNGNNDCDMPRYQPARLVENRVIHKFGGLSVIESLTEFTNLEVFQSEKLRLFFEEDFPRAMYVISYDGKVDFRGKDTLQAYLVRLSPGSVRASFEGHPLLPVIKNKPEKTVLDLADQTADLLLIAGTLVHGSPHPENLLYTPKGYKLVDYADTKLLAGHREPYRVLSKLLMFPQIQGISQADLEGYYQRITQNLGLLWDDTFKSPQIFFDNLWTRFFAPQLYEERKKGHHPYRTQIMEDLQEYQSAPPAPEVVAAIDQVEQGKQLDQKIGNLEGRIHFLTKMLESISVIQNDAEASKHFFKHIQRDQLDDYLLVAKERIKELGDKISQMTQEKEALQTEKEHLQKKIVSSQVEAEATKTLELLAKLVSNIKTYLEQEIIMLHPLIEDDDLAKEGWEMAGNHLQILNPLSTYDVAVNLSRDENFLLELMDLPYFPILPLNLLTLTTQQDLSPEVAISATVPYQILRETDYQLSRWMSDPTQFTTNLVVQKEGEKLLWKISRAPLTKSGSWSDLSGYDRITYLLTGGPVTLAHRLRDGSQVAKPQIESVELQPLVAHHFLGDWETDATVTAPAVDFNVIADRQTQHVVAASFALPQDGIVVKILTGIERLYYCARGKVKVLSKVGFESFISPGELIRFSSNEGMSEEEITLLPAEDGTTLIETQIAPLDVPLPLASITGLQMGIPVVTSMVH